MLSLEPPPRRSVSLLDLLITVSSLSFLVKMKQKMTVPVALLSPLFEALPLGLRPPIAMVTVHLQLIVDPGAVLGGISSHR